MIQKSNFSILFVVCISLFPVLSIHMPRALAFLPLLLGLTFSGWHIFIRNERLSIQNHYTKWIVAIAMLCVVSSLWSIVPFEAYKKSLKIFAILILSIPLFGLCNSLKIEEFKPYTWLLSLGVTLAALLCSFDLYTDLSLYRMIKGLDADAAISTAVMNRGVVFTTLSFFLALLFLKTSEMSHNTRIPLLIAMTISVLVMLTLTQSQSAQLSFILGVLSLLAFPHKIEKAYSFLWVLFVVALLATPWIAELTYSLLIDNAQTIPWLKDGYAGNRAEIWYFVSQYALNNPIYGYGVEATRLVPKFEHEQLYHESQTVLHPHNFSIQLWIEFGLAGMAFAILLFKSIIQTIQKQTVENRKYLLPIFISTLLIASIGYGLWQSWWLGTFIFLLSMTRLVTKPKTQP